MEEKVGKEGRRRGKEGRCSYKAVQYGVFVHEVCNTFSPLSSAS